MKAGDPAPKLSWTRVLQPAGYSGTGPDNFLGRVTVVLCGPVVSLNGALTETWNELHAKFRGEPVQFVWLTSEANVRHPLSGWLLFDSEMTTGHSFEIQVGSAVVDRAGKIAGYANVLPDEKQLREILAGGKSSLQAEPTRFPRTPRLGKPNLPPSNDVAISPATVSGTVSATMGDFLVRRGFDLKTVMAEVYEIEPSRIVLPASLDTKERWDFVLVPPANLDRQEMFRLVRAGMEKHFGIVTAFDERSTDVYVMSVTEVATPMKKAASMSEGCGWAASSASFPADMPRTLEAIQAYMESPVGQLMWINSPWAENIELDDFRRKLEEVLGRPIVDETNVSGSFDLRVRSAARTIEEAIRAIRDELGLRIEPVRRTIRMLIAEFRQ